jgi:hydrogenase large subunit
MGGDLATFKPITRPSATPTSATAWPSRQARLVRGRRSLHPYKGETEPKYTDFQDDGKYSWVKSPTFYGKPMQVGPLATCSWATPPGHEPTKKYVDRPRRWSRTIAGARSSR